MPENSQPAADNNDGGGGGGQEFVPITTQEELNRVIGDRLRRARPSDYDEVKAKADRLDELEKADLSELDKANSRAASLEADVASRDAEIERLRSDLLRSEVASSKGVPAHRINGGTREELEADADAYLAERGADKPAGYVPSMGTGGGQKTGPGGRERAMAYLGRNQKNNI